ncbi:MAG: hypothetical protein ACE5IJ_09900, partial [Thermoplasmata archaeon]
MDVSPPSHPLGNYPPDLLTLSHQEIRIIRGLKGVWHGGSKGPNPPGEFTLARRIPSGVSGKERRPQNRREAGILRRQQNPSKALLQPEKHRVTRLLPPVCRLYPTLSATHQFIGQHPFSIRVDGAPNVCGPDARGSVSSTTSTNPVPVTRF